VANLGKKPYLPFHSYIIEDMFLMRGEIIWDNGSSASSSTAWGTYLKADSETFMNIYLVQSSWTKKHDFKRRVFSAERATKIGHPARFPVELPYRLIQLYTIEGEWF